MGLRMYEMGNGLARTDTDGGLMAANGQRTDTDGGLMAADGHGLIRTDVD